MRKLKEDAMRKSNFIFVGMFIALIVALVGFPLAASAKTTPPPPPNNTGLTAKIVAHSGQTISGLVDATGYDIGIYIGPGVRNVTVKRATVSGANDEGILVQDTSDIVIKDSTISNNANTPGTHAGEGAGQLGEDKAIVLAGTTNCQVKDNTVENNGAGGISVLDDGPNHPFAINTVTTSPIAGTENLITGNLVKDNLNSCGIVVSAKNLGGGVFDSKNKTERGSDQENERGGQHDQGNKRGGGVYNNIVSKNTVNGYMGGPFVPNVGGIVVAGGAFGAVQVMDNVILNNVVTGGLIPGISIHAFGPAVISGTKLIGNVLSNNGGVGDGVSNNTTGIEIFAVPGGVITGTQVLSDTISNDVYGVWHIGDTATHIANLQTNSVTTPVFP